MRRKKAHVQGKETQQRKSASSDAAAPLNKVMKLRKGLSKPKQAQRPTKTISPEDLYSLRELMRQKYILDVQVYNMRKAVRSNLHIRDEAQRKSDCTMEEIRRLVGEWDDDPSWEGEERELVEDIQERLGLRSPRADGDGTSSRGDTSSVSEIMSPLGAKQ